MKRIQLWCVIGATLIAACAAKADIYTVTAIPYAFTAIANHLDNGGNTLGEVLPVVPAGSMVMKWACTDFGQIYTYTKFAGWQPSGGTLAPGEGALFFNNSGSAITLTFTGTPHVPVLPAVLPCGCGNLNFLSRQTAGVGTYENITGKPPAEDAQFIRWNPSANTSNTYTFSGGVWSPSVPTADVGESVWINVPCEQYKWDQPPVPGHPTNDFYYGWNEISMYERGPIAADDWVCTNYAPVTDVHWWGSFNHWCDSTPPPLPDAFQIAFWTDVPTNAAELFSHPGVVLQTVWCTNYTWQFVGWDFDPIRNAYEACFKFDQFLDPSEYFYQYPGTGTNIYWISIAAVYTNQPPQYPWGWKTRPRATNSPAPDDAVRIDVPTVLWPGAVYGFGQPLWWPTPTNSWDLAFELTSGWATNIVTKWEQLPDLSTNGMDVNASFQPSLPPPNLLASDFLCNSTGPLTEITIWASWFNDLLPGGSPGNVSFTLSIHSDIPVSPTNAYSQPGPVLWMQPFGPGQFTWSVFAPGLLEGWLDPPAGYIPIGDTICYQYNFQVDPTLAFVQTNGNIYWLDVQATPLGPEPARFGWKTSVTNWNDDSVWAAATEPWPGPWMELRRFWEPPPPPNPPRSIDLAFRLASEEMVEGVKWSQRPAWYSPTNAYNGWDEWSVYGSYQIVADDWVCTSTNPVTDIHWWGSFLNWCQAFPPQVPDAFHITIWTDVPTNANNSFSHPGVVIWETHCTNFTYELAGYDFDPRLQGQAQPAAPDTCFKFTQELTRSEWFYQNADRQTNIYWVSIAAVYANQNYQYPWGWKSRPRDTNSLAPDDAVRINDTTSPTIGKQYRSGSPIYWPGITNSWDMAFQLTTRTNQPPPPTNNVGQKWFQIPDTTPNGIDARVTDQTMLADDFRCTATGPITEVRIWGSWLNDVVFTNPCFCLGLWTDIPTNAANTYSRPGQLLCQTCFFPGQYTNFLYTNVYYEQFWDPFNPVLGRQDSQVWEYVFSLPTNSCWLQTNGNTYWLSVTIPPGCFDPFQYQFGWKTCPTNWNDDAVYGYATGAGWQELRRPPYFTNSLDLAFEIITQTNPCAPVSITCSSNLVVECGSTGWIIPLPVVSSPCCGTNYTLTRTVSTNGTCPEVLTFSWQVVDCAGYTATCTQTVTIVDTTPPVLTCATNKTVACGSPWSFDPPTAYDLCCGTNVTIGIVSTVTNGCQATRTWLATDCCTNSINCSQTVTVNDTNPPTIICPSNIQVLTCCTNIAVSWSITATDTCSSVTVASSPPSGSFFTQGTNTVTAVATDACGNSNTCSFLVIVRRPALSISLGGTPRVVTITWPSSGCLFQVATSVVGGAWTDLPLATSPYTVTPTNSPRFYRLRCP